MPPWSRFLPIRSAPPIQRVNGAVPYLFYRNKSETFGGRSSARLPSSALVHLPVQRAVAARVSIAPLAGLRIVTAPVARRTPETEAIVWPAQETVTQGSRKASKATVLAMRPKRLSADVSGRPGSDAAVAGGAASG